VTDAAVAIVIPVIVVLVTFEVAPADRERFVAARHDQVQRSRTEAGNLEYALSYDAADDRLVRLTERWESKAHLDAHLEVVTAQGPIADAPPVVSRELAVFEAQPLA
jgi:quinol monooxygenase YgiN